MKLALALVWIASAAAQDRVAISLRATDVAALRDAPEWWSLKALRGLVGGPAKVLAHDFGPDRKRPEYAFFAADTSVTYGGKLQDVKRSFVFLRAGALVAFDLAVSKDASLETRWSLEGTADGIVHTPAGTRKVEAETSHLNLIHLVEPPLPRGEVEWMDLAGVRLADWVVLFHAETRSARSAVSFEVKGGGRLRFLVTGLAPGTWEVWWNGWLEDSQGAVWRESGALYFEGEPGHYFLRRLN